MLAPYCSSGRLLVLLEHEPIRADVQGDRIRAVTVRDRKTGHERALVAPYFLDATELGDLLPLAGVEFVTGAEGQTQTGEPHAPLDPSPTTSRRSPAASRSITSTARTTRSTGPPSTTSGVTSSRAQALVARDACST